MSERYSNGCNHRAAVNQTGIVITGRQSVLQAISPSNVKFQAGAAGEQRTGAGKEQGQQHRSTTGEPKPQTSRIIREHNTKGNRTGLGMEIPMSRVFLVMAKWVGIYFGESVSRPWRTHSSTRARQF